MEQEAANVPEADEPAHAEARALPGPRAWLPFVGTPRALRAASDLLGFYEGYWREYGDTFRVRMFGIDIVVVVHPDAVKRVLWTNRNNYVKGRAYDGARRVMGDSLLTLEGEAWKSRRALEQPAFHRQSIERFTAHMVASGARFFDRLVERARAGSIEIDAHREMVKLTLDVVTSALFGQVLGQSPVSYETLSGALEFVSEGSNRLRLPDWVPTERNRKFERTLRVLDHAMHRFIDTARARAANDSLLSMLVAARDEQGAPLPNSVIRDEVMTLFIAGHETTALTLTWMFTLLYGRQDVIARMQSEVDAVLGDRDPTFADVNELRYLRQVVDETLRLRPPAPLIARDAVADDVIGGYRIHAGAMVMPFLWGTHRHPEFWPNPLQFDPSRFDAERATRRNSWSYVPFSAGPRVCIGNMFSLVETVVLLAQLLRRFELQVEPCEDIKPIAMATARPSRAVKIALTPRVAARAPREAAAQVPVQSP